MELKCKFCWKTFNSSRSKNKYCSRECWHKDREYDLLWKTFWSLSVIEKLWKSDRWEWVLWICKCECWKKVERFTRQLSKNKDCNCWCKRRTANLMPWTKFYHKYVSMRVRCENPKSDGYKTYWEKGIKCEWIKFSDFYDDMYESYVEHCRVYWESDTTIDRIDNTKNYCKENCRWATIKEQANNKTTNRLITYNWETMTLQMRSERIWITYHTLYHRLARWIPFVYIINNPNKRYFKDKRYVNKVKDCEEQLKKYI